MELFGIKTAIFEEKKIGPGPYYQPMAGFDLLVHLKLALSDILDVLCQRRLQRV